MQRFFVLASLVSELARGGGGGVGLNVTKNSFVLKGLKCNVGQGLTSTRL